MKPWTAEELEYLDTKWGDISIPAIASHLGRSVNAVKLKAGRRGMGRHIHNGEYITLNQLAIAIKHRYRTVRDWEKYGLPTKKKKSLNRSYAVIYIEDFWKWAENHKPLIRFERIEPLILGQEPEWVDKARIAAIRGKVKRTHWTKADDDKLIHMLGKYQYTYSDIAGALQRSEGAVKRRIYDLGLLQRPIRAEAREWTQEEIQTLMTLQEGGYSFEQIGNTLRRTALAVRGKYECLTNPEYMKQKHRGGGGYKGYSWREKK